ncbi:hypothetical protein EV714DRAFT_221988, partial [Schizophyllum commune]
FLLTGMVAVWGLCETPSSPSGACWAIRLGRSFNQPRALRLVRSTLQPARSSAKQTTPPRERHRLGVGGRI